MTLSRVLFGFECNSSTSNRRIQPTGSDPTPSRFGTFECTAREQFESEDLVSSPHRDVFFPRVIGLYSFVASAFLLNGTAAGQNTGPTPRSHKLRQFARHLYEPTGQAVLEVVGDSINATNTAVSMQVAYRDSLNIPINGWVVHADNGNSSVGYTNAQGSRSVDEVRSPGETFSSGVTAISPVRARDIVWQANINPGFNLSDCYILNSNLTSMRRGNPFASPARVDIRLFMFEGQTQVAGFEAAGMRALSTVSTGLYSKPSTPSGAIVWIDRTAGADPNNPGIRLRADTSTNESASGASTLIHLGGRFRANIANGVQVQFISHGGWTTADHASVARFTDAALAQFYLATDPPTHIILWLGQNQTLEESNDFAIGSYNVFKNDIAAVMDRHDEVIAAMGAPPPRWLLVSQYKTGYSAAYNLLMCNALYALAQERPGVSYLDMYQIAGGGGFDTATYLADGVHPNAGGVAYLGDLMNAEMESAACPADFDNSGFVDFVDYDAFIHSFEPGDPDADIDESGFVDIEDFSYFIDRFEAGC